MAGEEGKQRAGHRVPAAPALPRSSAPGVRFRTTRATASDAARSREQARFRLLSVAALRDWVRRARRGAANPATDQFEARCDLVIPMPLAVSVAFDEVCELARAGVTWTMGDQRFRCERRLAR
jgi:hypothetical protein